MAPYKHLDEARIAAIAALEQLLACEPEIERAVLIDDLYGRLRVVLWLAPGVDHEQSRAKIQDVLASAAQGFWTGDIWICDHSTGPADRIVYDGAWNEGTVLSDRLRIDDRHRNRTAWFTNHCDPPWLTRAPASQDEAELPAASPPASPDVGPPIIVFASFKGGVGRTTALASFALIRARRGERVVVIDFDLDAPGVGVLLAADEQGTTAPWGVVDYMLERQHGPVPLADYIHRCARPAVTGDGAIEIMPAGRLDELYLTKLSRVDLEIPMHGATHPLDNLLREVRTELAPDWILIDARAGLSPAAGLLLSGICHLHVLVGTTSEQSFKGMERMVHHLGADRLAKGIQADCLVVQSMVPDSGVIGPKATEAFRLRMEDIFTDYYYVAEDEADPDDRIWSLRDLPSTVAPHQPVVVPYRDLFAFFESIDQIAGDMADGKPYLELEARILGRFPDATNDDGD